MIPPVPEGRLRQIISNGQPVWKLQCPQCGHEGQIDDDQLHGRVSVDHTNCGATYPESECGCTFHETRDWHATAARW